MTASWDSLYLRSADAGAAAEALRAALVALGYTPFDPFAAVPGPAWPQAVRAFVAPAAGGWVRVIGTVDLRALPALSAGRVCLRAALDGTEAHIMAWRDGQQMDVADALRPYTRPGCDLQAALRGDGPAPALPVPDSASLFDTLPGDVRPLAAGVDMKQAQRMLDRLSGGLLKRAGADASAEVMARGLATGNGPDWESSGGRSIRALMACLAMPDTWREPDFVTLRDAYQLHLRRQRRPDARLYPGDAEALARVPDALAYTPVYAGRTADD